MGQSLNNDMCIQLVKEEDLEGKYSTLNKSIQGENVNFFFS